MFKRSKRSLTPGRIIGWSLLFLAVLFAWNYRYVDNLYKLRTMPTTSIGAVVSHPEQYETRVVRVHGIVTNTGLPVRIEGRIAVLFGVMDASAGQTVYVLVRRRPNLLVSDEVHVIGRYHYSIPQGYTHVVDARNGIVWIVARSEDSTLFHRSITDSR